MSPLSSCCIPAFLIGPINTYIDLLRAIRKSRQKNAAGGIVFPVSHRRKKGDGEMYLWMRSLLRSVVLWVYGGALYYLAEVIYKTAIGHQAEISWTMLVLGAIVSIALDRCNEHLPWEMPLLLQALLGGLGITAAELLAGLILNKRFGLNVWDYSALPCNLWGQISPRFTLLWIAVAGVGIVVFDWLRYFLYDEPRPNYKLL